jgi:hypothetical protein
MDFGENYGKCAGCGEYADLNDGHGVWLCDDCANQLEKQMDKEPAGAHPRRRG